MPRYQNHSRDIDNIKKAIIDYNNTKKSIKQCCEDHNISLSAFRYYNYGGKFNNEIRQQTPKTIKIAKAKKGTKAEGMSNWIQNEIIKSNSIKKNSSIKAGQLNEQIQINNISDIKKDTSIKKSVSIKITDSQNNKSIKKGRRLSYKNGKASVN